MNSHAHDAHDLSVCWIWILHTFFLADEPTVEDFDRQMQALRNSLSTHFNTIRRIFDYFAVNTGNDMQIKLNTFTDMIYLFNAIDDSKEVSE